MSTPLVKFLVFFQIPLQTMMEWSKVDPEQRAASERDLRAQWQQWDDAHASMLLSTEVGGKTKNVTAQGVSDTRNDIVICATVQAESHDAVAQAFQSHPHLQIPNASIQIMALRPMDWN